MNSEQKSPVVEICKTVNIALPQVPFEAIARKILGPRYELSLVVCGDSLARKMNRAYRKKDYAANVLSFPLAKNEGEIFLNIRAALRETKQYGVALRVRLMLLFVHACLHLKGLTHGMRMDTFEKRIIKRFG